MDIDVRKERLRSRHARKGGIFIFMKKNKIKSAISNKLSIFITLHHRSSVLV